MGLLDDDEELLRRPAFGNTKLARQVARTRALQAARSNDVNTLPDPQTYAFIQGLLGEAPDQMGFSPMNPDYAKIMGRGEQGMLAGTVSMVGPTAKAIKGLAGLGAKALGPTAVGMGERYLQRQGLMPAVVEGESAGLPDWNKSSILMSPENLKPLNKIEDAEKYKKILNSMQESGYQGRPILAYMDKGKAKALTGSHRLYAARSAGIEVPVVFVKPSVMKWEDNEGLFGTFKESINDQRVYQHLKAAGDETAASLAKLEDLLEPNEMPDAVRQYMADPASGLLQDEDERKLGGLLFR